jgi:cbb3-type cytochrome oxidase maturation protein
MESLYLLIPLSIVILAVAVAIFFWAVKSGQYEDVDREGDRILFDDDEELTSEQVPRTTGSSGKESSDD